MIYPPEERTVDVLLSCSDEPEQIKGEL